MSDTLHIITGGNGFTGRILIDRLLEQNATVVAFDHAPPPADLPAAVAHVQGDINDPAAVARLPLSADCIVYHLAARQFHLQVPKTGRDEWFAEVNVGGTATLLAAMRRTHAQRLVFVSTDMVYGLPQKTPVPPDHPLHPLGPYGRSKAAAEALIRTEMEQQGLRATIFRPRLISGPGRLGVLTKLFRLIELNLPVPLIGPGTNRYQMISVFDAVSAIMAAVAHDLPAGPFNLGSANPPLVRDLLRQLVRFAGSRSIVIPTPSGVIKPVLRLLDRLGHPLLYAEQFEIADIDYQLDDTLTRTQLGWQPQHDDLSMLQDAYRIYQEKRQNSRLAA